MKTIVKLKFGSHLYGTNTKNSDLDIKGVYLPTIEECLTNSVRKSITNNTNNKNTKNTKEDIDFQVYSLQYFLLNLGVSGDTTFLDMIHAPKECLIESSSIWDYITSQRKLFYTKNLKSYIGYCRTQASKYGVKGSRLEFAKRIIKFLDNKEDKVKIKEFWDDLPDGEFIKRYEIDNASSKDKRCYDFCGKKIMADTRVCYVKDIIQNFYDQYGARAELARKNEGIDWKAISHAFRAGYQLKEIYETGDLKFPLGCAEFLKDVKMGKLHYMNDKVDEKLTNLIDEVEVLASKSDFQERVDVEKVQKMVINIYNT